MIGVDSANYSSDEYQAWIARAPSTSALYESLNYRSILPRTNISSNIGSNKSTTALASGLSDSSLSKIAHSAESLLDTIRMEAQKNLLTDLYINDHPSSSTSDILTNIETMNTKSPQLKSLHSIRQLTSLPTVSSSPSALMMNRSIYNPNVNDYNIHHNLTTIIPNPTPVVKSLDDDSSKMNFLTLNPREFFKYKYDKNNLHPIHNTIDKFTGLPTTTMTTAATITTTGSATITTTTTTSTANDNLIVSDTPILGSTADSARTLLGYCGLLWIHLLAGRGLRASNLPTSNSISSTATPTSSILNANTNSSLTKSSLIGSNRDLYCVIECDHIHKARTVIRSGESSFDWDEVFELDIIDVKEVSFLLYSWNYESKHKLCYKGIVNLVSLNLTKTPVHSLALKMEPRGTLYIKMRYKEPAITFQRSLLTTSTVNLIIFGVDLDIIVQRENTGTNVPLLLKRCFDEIEKRGYNVIGIYRLCGSAVRKKMLRDAFEKNAWLVDLSAEHVPDINVITGLVKDYLRELPEPLFNKALFEMMLDGLCVCLPHDPNGNTKLMFSIIECLSDVTRATVSLIINHLKIILSHSETNKMNEMALATIFGPLFTCNYECDNIHKSIEVFKFLLDIWPTKSSKYLKAKKFNYE